MYLTFLMLLLAGLVIGLLSGLLGIGGGTLIVPLFRLACGLDAITAVGTSLFTIVPTSLSGMVGHLRNHTAHIRLGLLFGGCGALFAVAGALVSDRVPPIAVMSTAAVIIVYTAVQMLRKARRGQSLPAVSDGEGVQSTTQTTLVYGRRTIVLAACIGSSAGFLSGFVGVGGGFIMVPLAVWLFGLSMAEAAGTSLVAVVILAIPGAITHGLAGDIAYLEGIALAVGTIPGALLGGRLAKRVPERLLQGIFGVVLIIVGIVLVVNEFVIR